MRLLLLCCVLALVSLAAADGPSDRRPGPRPGSASSCPIESVPVIPFPQTNDGCTICDPRSGPSCPQSLFLSQMEGFWKCKYEALKAQLSGQLSMLSTLADIPPTVFAAHPELAPLPQCMNPVLTQPSPTPANPFAVELGSNTTLRTLIDGLRQSLRGRRSNTDLIRDAWCRFATLAGSRSPPLFTNYDIFNPVAPNMTRPALIHNHAGGVPLNTMFIYQSLTEYLAVLSAPLGTAGFGGRYLATTFIDLVLDGKVLHRMEGDVDAETNTKGTFYATRTGDFSPLQKATEYVCPPDVAPGSNAGGCLLLEYGHFPPTHLAHLLDFGVFSPTENITRDFKAGYQLLAQAATQIGANCYPNGFPTAAQIGAALGLPPNQP